MSDTNSMNRRTAILAATAGAGAILTGASLARDSSAAEPAATTISAKETPVKTYTNNDFYKDGVFQADKATQAYFDMFERFHFPIPPKLREEMWAIDFGLGDFVHAGMAGIFWINRQEDNYFGHDIYLLPGQMIIEHRHIKTEAAGPKMEGWHVRHGMIYTMGEGEPTDPLPFALPESQKPYITVKNCTKLMPGEVDYLKRAEASHFMMAGPEGAIVTEYATYHDGDGLRFTNPNAVL